MAREPRLRVGWVAAHSFAGLRGRSFRLLPASLKMRMANTARWLNANEPGFRNEMYVPGRRYDVVVFAKAMDERCQEEAARVHAYGGKVVFDANVNYYEVWGDYDVPGTKPTERQLDQAMTMTTLADWVVADSTYLLDLIRPLNPSSSWIPDNVDLTLYGRRREHGPRALVRLVWSGIAKKAQHLLQIEDALASLEGFELVLVADEPPQVLERLRRVLPTRYVRFGDRRYARTLAESDVIISPKRLSNAYEHGHSEWKITLGMAAGLPAVASSQPSYLEAISDRGGGMIADGTDEWVAALESLRDPARRAELGALARRTVEERYATPVVARQYGDLLLELA